MSDHTDDVQMACTDISEVDQVDSVMCVDQNNSEVIEVQEDVISKNDLGVAVKCEDGSHETVLGLHHHHSGVNIHSVSVSSANNAGIITIPVVGTLSPCQYSVIGDPDTVKWT